MQPGAAIHVAMSKWGDRPHWQFDGHLLGSDEHGTWLGFPRGTRNARPGFAFDSEVDAVTLVPTRGWFLATFHAPGIWCDRYVDVATPAQWHGTTLHAIDLDLDVIRMAPQPPPYSPLAPQNLRAGWGESFVDDEDEFIEHQIEYGYPADVVAAARATADQVLTAVRAGSAPFDSATAQSWLTQVRPLPVADA